MQAYVYILITILITYRIIQHIQKRSSLDHATIVQIACQTVRRMAFIMGIAFRHQPINVFVTITKMIVIKSTKLCLISYLYNKIILCILLYVPFLL